MRIIGVAHGKPCALIVIGGRQVVILIIGPLSILRAPPDIFPDIGIPVISIIYSYAGAPAQNIELSARREEIQIRFRRAYADVLVTKALGGGWQSAD
jgi:hypothetical protein